MTSIINATSLTQSYDCYRPTSTGTNGYGESIKLDVSTVTSGNCRFDVMNAGEALEMIGHKVKQAGILFTHTTDNINEGDYVEIFGYDGMWRVLNSQVLYRLKDGPCHRECLVVIE